MTDKPKFYKGQRVFAKDDSSGILYEATVRRVMFGIARQKQNHWHEPPASAEVDEEKEEWHCFVHYTGWNCKWDRWCSEGSLYEVTDKTRELAQKLQDAVKEAKKKHGSKSPHVMVELAQKMKLLEQERRLEERREELAKQGIVMQEQDEEDFSKDASTKFTKNYFKKELELREQDLQGKRKQAHAEKLVLPFSLKKVLVEQWEVITQCGMVPTLPVDVTVQEVLDSYLESKIGKPVEGGVVISPEKAATGVAEAKPEIVDGKESSKSDKLDDPVSKEASATLDFHEVSTNKVAAATPVRSEMPEDHPTNDEVTEKQEQEWKHMVDGIALLFDQAVGSRLLYRQELPVLQWIQQQEDLSKRRFCQVFGCEHFLRLFIRLPALLADQLSDTEARPIFSKLNDLVRFLQKHQGKIFLQTYQNPPEESSRKRALPDGAPSKKCGKRSRKAPSKAITLKVDDPLKEETLPPHENLGTGDTTTDAEQLRSSDTN